MLLSDSKTALPFFLAFPSAQTMSRLTPEQLGEKGVIRQRSRAILAIADAVASKDLELSDLVGIPSTLEKLESILGIYPFPLKMWGCWQLPATAPRLWLPASPYLLYPYSRALLYLLHPCSRHSPQSPTTRRLMGLRSFAAYPHLQWKRV